MQEHHLYGHVSANIRVLPSQSLIRRSSIYKGIPKPLKGCEDDNDHDSPECLVTGDPIGKVEDRRPKPAYYESNYVQGGLDGHHSFAVDLLLHLCNALHPPLLRMRMTSILLDGLFLLPNLPPYGRVGGNHNQNVGLDPGLREYFVQQTQGLRWKAIARWRLGTRFASGRVAPDEAEAKHGVEQLDGHARRCKSDECHKHEDVREGLELGPSLRLDATADGQPEVY